MAADATPETTTATVLRATERQVRLQLDGGREVTKRVTVPADVQVRGVDMAGELQILAFREQHSRLARSRTTKELLA